MMCLPDEGLRKQSVYTRIHSVGGIRDDLSSKLNRTKAQRRKGIQTL